MANYAHSMTQINFNKSVDNLKGNEIISEFEKEFGDVEIYNENCDTESLYGFDADFDWKWNAPIKELTEFCKKFNVTITGTSSDSAGYVEAFKLPKKKNTIDKAISEWKKEIKEYNYEHKFSKESNFDFIKNYDVDCEDFLIGFEQGYFRGLEVAKNIMESESKIY